MRSCTRPVGTAWRGLMVQTRSASARASAAAPGRATAAAAAAAAPIAGPPPPASQLPWEDVHNLRDLAEAYPAVLPGRVFRCAAPVYATERDIGALFGSGSSDDSGSGDACGGGGGGGACLGIREMIDLRSSDELKMLPEEHHAVFDGASFCRYVRDIATRRSVPDPLSTSIGDRDIMRVHIAPLEKRRLYRSLLMRMPLRTAAYVVATSLVDREAGRAAAIQEVNEGGLEGLYEILLDSAKPEFVASLQRILLAAEQGRPVLFFCKAGKDRTGILAALLLSVLGATEDQIVADYIKSDEWHHVALAGIENDSRVASLDRAKFERAPAQAMRHALAYVKRTAGGVEEYLEAAGLQRADMARLRAALLQPQGAAKL